MKPKLLNSALRSMRKINYKHMTTNGFCSNRLNPKHLRTKRQLFCFPSFHPPHSSHPLRRLWNIPLCVHTKRTHCASTDQVVGERRAEGVDHVRALRGSIEEVADGDGCARCQRAQHWNRDKSKSVKWGGKHIIRRPIVSVFVFFIKKITI